MTLLPFSFAESTAASAKRVASVDASLEALRAELLALQLPDAAGENGPESYERAVSSALGLCLAGRGNRGTGRVRGPCGPGWHGVLPGREVCGGDDEFVRPGAL